MATRFDNLTSEQLMEAVSHVSKAIDILNGYDIPLLELAKEDGINAKVLVKLWDSMFILDKAWAKKHFEEKKNK